MRGTGPRPARCPGGPVAWAPLVTPSRWLDAGEVPCTPGPQPATPCGPNRQLVAMTQLWPMMSASGPQKIDAAAVSPTPNDTPLACGQPQKATTSSRAVKFLRPSVSITGRRASMLLHAAGGAGELPCIWPATEPDQSYSGSWGTRVSGRPDPFPLISPAAHLSGYAAGAYGRHRARPSCQPVGSGAVTETLCLG